MIHLIEFIGVTYTYMTYSIDCAFIEFKNSDNVTCSLEMCRNLLKEPNIMLHLFVTDQDTSIMKFV